MSTPIRSFRLAPMCNVIKILTLVLLALPLIFVAGSLFGNRLLWGPAFLVIAIYSWVWLRFRPKLFVVRPGMLEVVWPLKHRRIPRGDISGVLLINRKELKREVGWGLRVGAGGLWGGFGWLWTQRRGVVQMYISRIDRFVWIERTSNWPWLITPEEPEEFVRVLLQINP